MSQLRSMVHRLIRKACDELFEELIMVGSKFEGSDKGRPVPLIN
jgi:hypothetical protein